MNHPTYAHPNPSYSSRTPAAGLPPNAQLPLPLPNNPNLTPQQQQALHQAQLIQKQQQQLAAQQSYLQSSQAPIAGQASLQQRSPLSIPQPSGSQHPHPLVSQQHQSHPQQHQSLIQQRQAVMLQQQQQLQKQNQNTQMPVHPAGPSAALKRPPPSFAEVVGPNTALQRAKRFKPTDRTLPCFDPPIKSEDDNSADPKISLQRESVLHRLAINYNRLQKMEQDLDWNISRKRLELQDCLKRPMSVKRTLRVKVWNTVTGQIWQQAAAENSGDSAGAQQNEKEQLEDTQLNDASVDFTTGQGIPNWTLHVEGHLLDSPRSSVEPDSPQSQPIAQTERTFSSLLNGIMIRVDRPNELYPEPNLTEWHQSNTSISNTTGISSSPSFSKFLLTRSGTESCEVQIALHLAHFPQKVKLLPPLRGFLDLNEATLAEILDSLWVYIKKERLQDPTDKRLIRQDANLACLFPPGGERMPFYQLSEGVRRFIGIPDPALITYQISVAEGCEERAQYFDIEFAIEDPAKLHISQILEGLEADDESCKEIIELDDQIMEAIARLREVKIRRDFHGDFSKNPIDFITTWIKSQSRDLEVLFGMDKGSELGQQRQQLMMMDFSALWADSKHSYQQDWLEDAIRLYEGRGFNERVLKQKMAVAQPSVAMTGSLLSGGVAGTLGVGQSANGNMAGTLAGANPHNPVVLNHHHLAAAGGGNGHPSAQQQQFIGDHHHQQLLQPQLQQQGGMGVMMMNNVVNPPNSHLAAVGNTMRR